MTLPKARTRAAISDGKDSAAMRLRILCEVWITRRRISGDEITLTAMTARATLPEV